MDAFPAFDLESADGDRVTELALVGHPSVVYLARHPGWNVCRSYLRRVVEALPALAAAGASLVVVTPQQSSRAAVWREELGLAETLVIADPGRVLYQALGARRPVPLWVIRPRVALAGLRALRARESVGVTRGDDTLQLGADVVVDRDGLIAFLRLAADAADRVPADELLAVVRDLEVRS